MANVDIVLDTLIRIQNATRVNKPSVAVAKGGLVKAILTKLHKRGYIASFSDEPNSFKVELAYDKGGHPVIHGVEKISKMGRRVYTGYKDIKPVFGGRGMYLVSTPKGVLTDQEARKTRQGGELICKIW